MGIRNFVRNRKQVSASRATEDGGAGKAATAKFFGSLGGNNGAMGANGSATAYRGTTLGFQNPGGDSYGRRGAMANKPSYTEGRASTETPEQESARGARFKISDNVTVLGSKSNGAEPGRAPINAQSRESATQAYKENYGD